jgi:hypothetical protein
MDVLKLDWVLHLPLRLSPVSPQCQAREASTGRGGPHWRGWAPRACRWAQQAIHGQARDMGGGGSGAVIRTLATPYYSRALLRYLQMTMDRSFISIGRSRRTRR